jgi:hypothetical protein
MISSGRENDPRPLSRFGDATAEQHTNFNAALVPRPAFGC